ncbi:CPBP family intramembrane glutamic endopeptidase [Pseudonocardia phyllosphaerae]|uniref:CPBP family intramembrane glutamic endopeptidase n=1 Tax=Pseudonocardia phyllosphaerae TaxID=3390502 RepID=UPI00397A12D3
MGSGGVIGMDDTVHHGGDGTVPEGGYGPVPEGGDGPVPDPGRAGTGSPPIPGAGPPGGRSLGWIELIAAVVLYVALTAVGGLGLALVLGLQGMLRAAVPLLVVTGTCTLLTALIALALRVRWPGAVGLRRSALRWLVIAVVGALVLRGLAFGVGVLWTELFGEPSNPQAFLGEALSGTDPLTIAGVMLAGALLVPFAEELLFRGIGYGALRQYGGRYAVVLATVVSAAVFALAHGLNVVMPIAFLLGVTCALLYERSRSIWPGVVAHVVFNASGFVLATLLL